MSRETICRRVVGNLDDYDREVRRLRKDEVRLNNELAKLDQDMSAALMRSVEGSSGVGRRPAIGGRGGRGGSAFDILTGVGGALLNDNSSEVRRINEQARQTKKDLDDIIRQIDHILQNVRRQQSEFNEFQCYNLGYSHEVLNVRSADGLLEQLWA